MAIRGPQSGLSKGRGSSPKPQCMDVNMCYHNRAERGSDPGIHQQRGISRRFCRAF